MTGDEMFGWHLCLDGVSASASLSLALGDGQGSLACGSSWD